MNLTIVEQARQRLLQILPTGDTQLLQASVSVLARPLTPEEAIGTPGRRDYPIIVGKERVIEAVILGSRGHAFTDTPREFIGTLQQVLELPLDSNHTRAIFIATLNATMRHMGRVTATVHCKDDDPEICAQEMAQQLHQQFGAVRVGLVGLNPAIAEQLAQTFGADQLHITDLNRDNVGRDRFGVQVWDGQTQTEQLIRESGLLLVTGTTLVNGSFDRIHELARAGNTPLVVYGVTAAGVCELMHIDRLCPRGRDQ